MKIRKFKCYTIIPSNIAKAVTSTALVTVDLYSKDGKQEPTQTFTKTIQLDIPLTAPTGTDAFEVNDMNTVTEEITSYDSLDN